MYRLVRVKVTMSFTKTWAGLRVFSMSSVVPGSTRVVAVAVLFAKTGSNSDPPLMEPAAVMSDPDTAKTRPVQLRVPDAPTVTGPAIVQA